MVLCKQAKSFRFVVFLEIISRMAYITLAIEGQYIGIIMNCSCAIIHMEGLLHDL